MREVIGVGVWCRKETKSPSFWTFFPELPHPGVSKSPSGTRQLSTLDSQDRSKVNDLTIIEPFRTDKESAFVTRRSTNETEYSLSHRQVRIMLEGSLINVVRP